MPHYKETIEQIRRFYNRDADGRDLQRKPDWKVQERDRFLTTLHEGNCQRLLELGAGTGQDSLFFQDNGLDVMATDVSPAMVEYCKSKGLNALEMDFLSLDFPAETFDALYAVNCLLHVPKLDFRRVMQKLHTLLKPGGVFYMGLYGGEDSEVIRNKELGGRLFISYSEASLIDEVEQLFAIDYFNRIGFGSDWPQCFYSIILIKPDAGGQNGRPLG